MKTQPTKVQKLVYSMLTENTGSHFLDSGGAYGRHWERNQKKTIQDFIHECEVSLIYNRKYKELERCVSVFHYLSNLELDEICDQFNKANKNTKDWDGDLYGVSSKAQRFLERLSEIYGISEPRVWNTYNGDSDLSQTLQGASFQIDGEDYMLVQIHNGCDVRGGYTDAKLFKVTDEFYNIWEYMSQDEIIENELEYITLIDENGLTVPDNEKRELFELV